MVAEGRVALERVAPRESSIHSREASRSPILDQPWASWLFVVAPVLLIVFVFFWYGRTDPDYWWHYRTGEFIVQTGALPRYDPFSHTAGHHPWVTHEWLTEVVFFAVQSAFGYAGVVALFAVVRVAALAFIYATCRLWGVNELFAMCLTIVASLVGWGATTNVRPQLLTVLCLAITAYLLTRYRLGHRRAIWLLPALTAVWVNLHGGYVIGLALLGLTCVAETVERFWRSGPPLRSLYLVTVLSGVAALANPHGIEALIYPFTYAGTGNASMRYIAEWQSPNFHLLEFAALGGALLLLITVGVGRAPIGLTGALWVLAFSVLALRSARHIPLFGLIAMPLVAARIVHEFPALRRSFREWRRPRLVFVLLPLALVTALLVIANAEKRGLQPQVGAAPNAVSYPAAAAAYIKAHDPPGEVFNDYNWGGYLVYELYPQKRVFIDGRADVFGDDFIERFQRTQRLAPGWRETFAEYGVGIAIVSAEGTLGNALAEEPGWVEIKLDAPERLFLRSQ